MSAHEGTDENKSSVQYTPLPSSMPKKSKLKPPLWNTPEFYLYYVCVIVVVPYMFKGAYDVSKETHPNYHLYKKHLEPGWIFGRRVDNSDVQLASFRTRYPVLVSVIFVYLAASRIFRAYFVPKTPAKLANQDLPLAHFNLGFSLIFLFVLYGNSIIKILLILIINYAIGRVFKSSIVGPVLTWVFNFAILFLNETYRGYKFQHIDQQLAFLDQREGLLGRWHVTFNICMLRLVSYNMDYYWSFRAKSALTENDRDGAPLNDKDRITRPCFREDYNFAYYLSYILYAPLYLAGPIITYNNYISQLRYPKAISIKSTALYGLRVFAAILAMEFILHYIYVVAITKVRGAWDGDTPFQLCMISYFNLKIIWLKLLIIWRLFRFWAMADGMDVEENMGRCMTNNYSALAFWRSWHRSFNRWIIRYIYIPLGGSKYSLYNIWPVFTFVAIWHDLSFTLLAWSWLICLFILPEVIASRIFSEDKWGNWPYYRHLCAVGGVCNIVMMMIANLVGFSIGIDGVLDLLKHVFTTLDGILFFTVACMCIFVAIQLMFEVREEEKRRHIDKNRT